MKMRICLVFLLSLLWNCGDNARIDSKNVPRLSAYIHFVPSGYYGISYKQFPSVRNKSVAVGEAGQLVAEIRSDGVSVPENFTSDYIQNFIWRVEGKNYISQSVFHTFPDSGIFDIVLGTVDFFNDTLRDTLTLFVSTPIQVVSEYPENGASVNPLDSRGITFRTKTDGINSWQEAKCVLYISREKALVSESPISEVPCNGSHQIRGPLMGGDSADFRDTSHVFHWRVLAYVPGSENSFDRDSTEIRQFRTTLVGRETSRLTIPIRYKSLSPSVSPSGTVVLSNGRGDVLARATVTENPSVVRFENLTAGDTLRIAVHDSVRTEYGEHSESIYLPKSTDAHLDTILLSDTIPPLRTPKLSRMGSGDSLTFFLYDAGSGISPNSVRVLLGTDTLARSLRGNTVRFLPTCESACPLEVELRDYAGNSASPIFWKLSRSGDSIDVLGPFNPENP